MTPETCKITEPFPGVFATTLPFCTSALLQHLLVSDQGFVLTWGHYAGNYTWRRFSLPVGTSDEVADVHSRLVTFDFVATTAQFRALLSTLRPSIAMVQLGRFPPDHLDLARIKGRERYRLLSESSWLFEFQTPGNDFAQLLTPSRTFLESFLGNNQLNFGDLP